MTSIRPQLRKSTAATLFAVGCLIVAAAASAAGSGFSNASGLYTFNAVTNPADPSFDQLLGINNHGLIVGYYGSGASAKHPNKGFALDVPNGLSTFTNENYPGAAQTQVVAVTANGSTAGFWVNARGGNHGFVDWKGTMTTVDDPLAAGKVKTNQILGLNDRGVAVGFYNDAQGNPHAFKYNLMTRTFTTLMPPHADSAVATGINASDQITGFLTRGKTTESFVVSSGRYTELRVPGSANTQAFGINNRDEIVGSYLDAAGKTHGFSVTTPTMHPVFSTIDDPHGIGNTILNGVNDKGQVVGFYMDAAKSIGFFATP
jgi:uncharacterized membrane protein